MMHKEKVIIITGASSGIGKALYRYFKLNSDYETIGISRRGPNISVDFSHRMRSEIQLFTGLQGNEYYRNRGCSLLVNCAGIMPLDEAGMERSIFDVNFWSIITTTKVVCMCQGGCIINIASISGMKAEAELPIYAASKAAVISYTKSCAKALAPDVRVNSISPGYFKTELVPGPTPIDMIQSEVPMGYEEQPANLVPLIETIWNTPYMTGVNVVIDGGALL